MKPSSILLTLVLLLPVGLSAQQNDPRVDRLQAYLHAAADLGHINGSVLVAEAGQVLVDTAFGFANFELAVRNTPDTRFRVASVTKQFTGLAIMMLAQEGKLRLDAPINSYLDSIPAAWSQITVHQLLRHTSGISDYEGWFGGYSTQAYSDYMSQAHAAERIVHDARSRPLDFAPGSKFHYSNTAYVMLGQIIERVSGMPYADFLREKIHRPLGMTLSDQDRSDVIIADRAAGYQIRPGTPREAYFNGIDPATLRNAVYQKMEPPQAEAGLLTTARDLYKWDQALYTEQLLPRAALDSIFTPGLGDYGYGWFIRHGPDGVSYEHSGGLPGFTCYIMRIPGSHRTIIVLNNVQTLGRTVTDLAAILRGDSVPLPRDRHLIPADSGRDTRYVGRYQGSDGDSVTVRWEGSSLMAHLPDGRRSRLYPAEDGSYFVEALRGEARFRSEGRETELELRDGWGRVERIAVRR